MLVYLYIGHFKALFSTLFLGGIHKRNLSHQEFRCFSLPCLPSPLQKKKKNAEQLLKIPGAIGNLFIPGKGLSQKNPAPASHVESRAGALAGSPGQPYPSSEYCGFLELLGSLSIFLLWFLICIQSMCWCRVALARVVVDSFELFMKSHEVGFFWDAVVTLMCCAGSRSSQGWFWCWSKSHQTSVPQVRFGAALCSARAIQQEKEHLGFPSHEEQPHFSPLSVLFLKSCLAENRILP